MGMSTRGGAQKSRRHRRGGHQPMSEINVTPFVDVMLVLLIIFMVAAPLLSNGIPLELPTTKGKQLQAPKEQPIIVSIAADGRIFLGDEREKSMTLTELTAKLFAIKKAREKGDMTIFVKGDKGVQYGVIARAMGQLSASGFSKITLETQAAGG